MATARHDILSAIDDETRARRGPMPPALVPIACNCKTAADRDTVHAHLITLHAEGLVQYVTDPLRGKGVMLTDAGQRVQQMLPADRKPAPSRPLAPQSATPSPEPSAAPPAEPAAPAGLEPINPERQPELATLLCDLAGVLAEQLSAARLAGDVERLHRYRELANRLQRHLGVTLP